MRPFVTRRITRHYLTVRIVFYLRDGTIAFIALFFPPRRNDPWDIFLWRREHRPVNPSPCEGPSPSAVNKRAPLSTMAFLILFRDSQPAGSSVIEPFPANRDPRVLLHLLHLLHLLLPLPMLKCGLKSASAGPKEIFAAGLLTRASTKFADKIPIDTPRHNWPHLAVAVFSLSLFSFSFFHARPSFLHLLS